MKKIADGVTVNIGEGRVKTINIYLTEQGNLYFPDLEGILADYGIYEGELVLLADKEEEGE